LSICLAVNVLLRGRLERQFGAQLAQRRKDVEHDRKLGLIPELPSSTNGATLGAGAAVHMAPAVGPGNSDSSHSHLELKIMD
jgi:hypothetical protein